MWCIGLRRCRSLDMLVICHLDRSEGRRHRRLCVPREKVEIVRGSEDNVLGRYALAAERTRADIIVRVCADTPFLDPGFIDHLVAALAAQNGDYVVLPPDAKCAHEGRF